ncbi:MAG: hypothetical protein IPM46_12280 [Flavobacteriales bacterium]|nr:hypothetical protein [Flavobacteriales bacterium]
MLAFIAGTTQLHAQSTTQANPFSSAPAVKPSVPQKDDAAKTVENTGTTPVVARVSDAATAPLPNTIATGALVPLEMGSKGQASASLMPSVATKGKTPSDQDLQTVPLSIAEPVAADDANQAALAELRERLKEDPANSALQRKYDELLQRIAREQN